MTMSNNESAERQLRVHLETFASRMAREVIAPEMPESYGFAFIAFDVGRKGNIAYCSSASRDDMRVALAELLQRWGEEDSLVLRHCRLVAAATRLSTALALSVTTEDDSADEERLARVIGQAHDDLVDVLKMEATR